MKAKDKGHAPQHEAEGAAVVPALAQQFQQSPIFAQTSIKELNLFMEGSILEVVTKVTAVQRMLERTHGISGGVREDEKGRETHEGQAAQTVERLENVQPADGRQGYEGQQILAPSAPGRNDHGGKHNAVDEERLGGAQAEDPAGISRKKVGAGADKAGVRLSAGVLHVEFQRALAAVRRRPKAVSDFEAGLQAAQSLPVAGSRAVGEHDDEIHVGGIGGSAGCRTAEEDYADQRRHAIVVQLSEGVQVLLNASGHLRVRIASYITHSRTRPTLTARICIHSSTPTSGLRFGGRSSLDFNLKPPVTSGSHSWMKYGIYRHPIDREPD